MIVKDRYFKSTVKAKPRTSNHCNQKGNYDNLTKQADVDGIFETLLYETDEIDDVCDNTKNTKHLTQYTVGNEHEDSDSLVADATGVLYLILETCFL